MFILIGIHNTSVAVDSRYFLHSTVVAFFPYCSSSFKMQEHLQAWFRHHFLIHIPYHTSLKVEKQFELAFCSTSLWKLYHLLAPLPLCWCIYHSTGWTDRVCIASSLQVRWVTLAWTLGVHLEDSGSNNPHGVAGEDFKHLHRWTPRLFFPSITGTCMTFLPEILRPSWMVNSANLETGKWLEWMVLAW